MRLLRRIIGYLLRSIHDRYTTRRRTSFDHCTNSATTFSGNMIVFWPCFLKVKKPENCFFVHFFPDGGQTRKHCFVTIFLEGGQTRKHCFLKIHPDRKRADSQPGFPMVVCSISQTPPNQGVFKENERTLNIKTIFNLFPPI